jgi:hypothetical protein
MVAMLFSRFVLKEQWGFSITLNGALSGKEVFFGVFKIYITCLSVAHVAHNDSQAAHK